MEKKIIKKGAKITRPILPKADDSFAQFRSIFRSDPLVRFDEEAGTKALSEQLRRILREV